MSTGYLPAWKKAPFIRFLLPLIIGIILQCHLQLPVGLAWAVLVLSILLSILSFLFSYFSRYKFGFINGIGITIVFLATGSLLAWYKDIRHKSAWYGNYYKQGDVAVVVLKEPPVEKTNSYKALATIVAIQKDNEFFLTKGDLIIYFTKDSTLGRILDYGSQIIFSQTLQEIKNAGNPGGFDYKRYSLFQDITHQVYLKQDDFIVLKKRKQTLSGKMLFTIRKKVLSVLRNDIHGEKVQGLAEALLIGYKDDLDKNLVQSYSNTGVVHVIAISGLHLGLIYWLLVQLFRPLRKIKHYKWFVPAIIISGLWLFSLVAGGQPSVLRSAVMFTCIVLAENFSRKTSIYNTLALSAFVLLCINPYWLWDVGFQLSYAAVLSIVIFMKPIYNWFYIKNKALDFIWKLNAVSLAAQLLTTPFSIYHFHQFPNFFLLTNFIAVPLSSVILLGEIFLCAVSFIPFLAAFTGKALSWLIWLMNSYIEKIASLPYSLWDGMQVSIVQSALLIIVVTGFGFWLLDKQKAGVWFGIIALLLFTTLRSLSFYRSNQQQKLIVYNVPKYQAIDIIEGRNYFFIGNSELLTNEFVRNFHIKPSRILHRVEPAIQLTNFSSQENFLQYGRKRILRIDRDVVFDTISKKISIDLLLISKNPKLYIPKLCRTFIIRQVVFDGSTSSWKLKYWTNDCDSLHIPYHNVNEKGAFVMNLN
jgi:competence protein ComEC